MNKRQHEEREHVVVSNTERQFDWNPHRDITVYELARCMPMFSMDWHQIGRLYDGLPDEAKRHWEVFNQYKSPKS